MSNNLMEPSPQATRSWSSLISDHAKSYNASFVSKLPQHVCQCTVICRVKEKNAIRFLYLDARSSQAERKHAPTANNTEVGCRCDSHPVVIIWRVFHSIGIETPRAKLKHRSHGGKCEEAGPAM